MQAYKETTKWGSKTPNHTYLLDGSKLVAYIKQGDTAPVYFKTPIKGFDQRGRTFVRVDSSPFDKPVQDLATVEVTGSQGQSYFVNTEEKTCTCSGFTFRGNCKHLKEFA
jgi:hypothetical protein